MTATGELDSKLRQVQALLARADHPNTPPAEAEAARLKAELLMHKYRIEEAMLGDAGKLPGYEPVWRTITVCRVHSEFRYNYQQLMAYILHHVDAEGVYHYTTIDGELMVVCEAVGYDTDLRFVEMLYTQCALAFSKRLEPKYDPELSDQVNAYLMRMGGMEGRRIAMAIYGKDDKHLRPKVRKMFADEAKARGENPNVLLGKGNSVKTYRSSYAEGFLGTMVGRLRDVAMAHGAEGAIVLASRKEKVKEAFYTKYPQYRPQPIKGTIGETNNTPCPKCARTKGGYCREHMYRKPRAMKDRPFNGAAYSRGSNAAKEVQLGDH